MDNIARIKKREAFLTLIARWIRLERRVRVEHSDDAIREIESTLVEASERLIDNMPGDFDSLEPVWQLAKLGDFEGCQSLYLSTLSEGLPELNGMSEIVDRVGLPPAIPPDKMTKPISKIKAAKLLDRDGDPSSAVEWLNNCIEDGTIRWMRRTRQTGVYHIDDFPESARAKLKPNPRATHGK